MGNTLNYLALAESGYRSMSGTVIPKGKKSFSVTCVGAVIDRVAAMGDPVDGEDW